MSKTSPPNYGMSNTGKPMHAVETIDFRDENSKILFELIRYSGKNVNILELYESYKVIYAKYKESADTEKDITSRRQD